MHLKESFAKISFTYKWTFDTCKPKWYSFLYMLLILYLIKESFDLL